MVDAGQAAAFGKPQKPRANGSPAVNGKGRSMAPDARGSVSASRTLNGQVAERQTHPDRLYEAAMPMLGSLPARAGCSSGTYRAPASRFESWLAHRAMQCPEPARATPGALKPSLGIAARDSRLPATAQAERTETPAARRVEAPRFVEPDGAVARSCETATGSPRKRSRPRPSGSYRETGTACH